MQSLLNPWFIWTSFTHNTTAFMMLNSLSNLNVACNPDLGFEAVLETVSNTPTLFDTLILDNIVHAESDSVFVFMTKDQFCLNSLLYLKRLSIRYNKVISADYRFITECMPELHTLSAGYNYISANKLSEI